MRVAIPSGDLRLEGELVTPAAFTRGAVICHPHPQYGGDMDNPVVMIAAGALERAGCATLRFNFRGVGASEGTYGGGIGELDDVRSAARFLLERIGPLPITAAGYSFGAAMALQAGRDLAEVDRLIAIAPPLAFFSLEALASCTKAKHFVVGDRDQFCSLSQLRHELERLPEPKCLEVVEGADHFFGGYEKTLARCLVTS